jgi:hypothetical protein
MADQWPPVGTADCSAAADGVADTVGSKCYTGVGTFKGGNFTYTIVL